MFYKILYFLVSFLGVLMEEEEEEEPISLPEDDIFHWLDVKR